MHIEIQSLYMFFINYSVVPDNEYVFHMTRVNDICKTVFEILQWCDQKVMHCLN